MTDNLTMGMGFGVLFTQRKNHISMKPICSINHSSGIVPSPSLRGDQGTRNSRSLRLSDDEKAGVHAIPGQGAYSSRAGQSTVWEGSARVGSPGQQKLRGELAPRAEHIQENKTLAEQMDEDRANSCDS